MYFWFVVVLGFSACGLSAAPASFESAKKVASRVYSAEKQEFYCGCAIRWQAGKGTPDLTSCGYQVRKNGPRASRIEWEHVMPAQQFGSPLSCWQQGGRKQCAAKDPLFQQMEADLFNLKPAIGEVNGDRAHYRFGMLPNAKAAYGQCPVKIDFQARLVEPRAQIRGDIARIHFYMADKYGIVLAKAQQQLFMAWHQQDPVDAAELQLQQRIAQQMGHANEFVTGKKHWVLNYQVSRFGLVGTAMRSVGVSPASSASAFVKGNKNSKLYHLSHCSGYGQIAERNQVIFASEQQARDAGFSLAGNCKATTGQPTGD
ncbi:endonuclease [Rheinheimera sp.]|uniref:endonuclease n=1 Tax=Rheinheimera sp. TaxID=1869214 RepID=UPI003AF864AE